MRVRPVIASLPLAFVLALAAPGLQAEPDPACRDAARALCGESEDRDAFRRCIREQRGEMPEVCRERAAQRRERFRSVIEICREDAQELCGDIDRGKGRVVRCLRENEADVSTACASALSEMPQRPEK